MLNRVSAIGTFSPPSHGLMAGSVVVHAEGAHYTHWSDFRLGVTKISGDYARDPLSWSVPTTTE